MELGTGHSKLEKFQETEESEPNLVPQPKGLRKQMLVGISLQDLDKTEIHS